MSKPAPKSGKEVIARMLAIYRTKGWTRGPMAVDQRNRAVSFLSPNVAKLCLWGCLLRASGTSENLRAYRTAYRRLEKAVGGNIVVYNEAPGRTKRQVMDMLRRAAQ